MTNTDPVQYGLIILLAYKRGSLSKMEAAAEIESDIRWFTIGEGKADPEAAVIAKRLNALYARI